MTREVLLFLIVFAAGLLIAVFLGIIWMTAVWEKLAASFRERGRIRRTTRPVLFTKRASGY